MFCKNGVLRNFAKLTGKDLCQSLFFHEKETLAQVFSCELTEISEILNCHFQFIIFIHVWIAIDDSFEWIQNFITILENLNWSNITNIFFKRQKSYFIFDFLINDDVPDGLKKFLILNVSVHSFITRSSQVFHTSKTRIKFRISALTFDSTKIWNQFYFGFIFNELVWQNLDLKVICNEVTSITGVAFALWVIFSNDFVPRIPKVVSNTNIEKIVEL